MRAFRGLVPLIGAAALALCVPAGADAQPAAAAPAAAPAQPESSSAVPVPAGAPYSYRPDGRRDPFQSLTATTTDEKAPRPTAAGIAGIRIDELAVRGVMQSRDRLVAMVQGPDKRTYVIHPGDRLADGMVKSINPQGVVLLQDVDDPRAKE
jgi:Tfp pilus assembly protein PilP